MSKCGTICDTSHCGFCRKRWWAWLGTIVLLGAAARVLALMDASRLGFFSQRLSDALVYERRAREILAGDWLGPADFMHAPLYAYVLAAIKALGGTGDWAPRFWQIGFSLLAILLLAHAGRRWFTPVVGLLAALLLSLNPHAIFSDTIIQKTTLTTLLSVAALFALGRVFLPREGERGIFAWPLAMGAIMGLLTLDRQNAIVLLPVVMLVAFVGVRKREWGGWGKGEVQRGGPRLGLAAAALVLVGWAVIMTPWVVRHRIVLGDFVLSGPNLGQNFEMGNRPDATGTYLRPSRATGTGETEQAGWVKTVERATGKPASARDVSDWYLRRSLDWMKSDPGAWLALTGRKTLMFLGAYEWPDLEDFYLLVERSAVLRALDAVLHWGVLLPLAAGGLALTWRDRARWWPLAAWAGVISASIIAFVVFGRYRAPVLPVVLMFGGAALVEAWLLVRPGAERGRAASDSAVSGGVSAGVRPWPRVTVAAAVVLALALVCNVWASWPRTTRGFSHTNHAVALADLGRGDEAEADFDRALALEPGDPAALAVRASVRRQSGRRADALADYEAALKSDPEYPIALRGKALVLADLNLLEMAEEPARRAVALDNRDYVALTLLGSIEARRGKLKDAEATLRRAVEAGPMYVNAHINLGNVLLMLGDAPRAEAAYLKAVAIEPSNTDVLFNLGVLDANAGRHAEAAAWFARILSVYPNFRDARAALVDCLVRAGDLDAARRAADAAHPPAERDRLMRMLPGTR
ncbi:MAG: tetratricopeptide repeat protein [Planctomycetes bacterium]|nr:tetratricopeptide repeat protein [Planctomycetota bacterium]